MFLWLSRWNSLARSGSLWLFLALSVTLSGSLRLFQARSAAAALQRFLIVWNCQNLTPNSLNCLKCFNCLSVSCCPVEKRNKKKVTKLSTFSYGGGSGGWTPFHSFWGCPQWMASQYRNLWECCFHLLISFFQHSSLKFNPTHELPIEMVTKNSRRSDIREGEKTAVIS